MSPHLLVPPAPHLLAPPPPSPGPHLLVPPAAKRPTTKSARSSFRSKISCGRTSASRSNISTTGYFGRPPGGGPPSPGSLCLILLLGIGIFVLHGEIVAHCLSPFRNAFEDELLLRHAQDQLYRRTEEGTSEEAATTTPHHAVAPERDPDPEGAAAAPEDHFRSTALTSAAARSYVERIRFLPRVNGAVGSINDEPEVEVLYGLSPADDPNELSLQRVFELIQGPDYALPTKLYAFYCFFGLALSGCVVLQFYCGVVELAAHAGAAGVGGAGAAGVDNVNSGRSYYRSYRREVLEVEKNQGKALEHLRDWSSLSPQERAEDGAGSRSSSHPPFAIDITPAPEDEPGDRGNHEDHGFRLGSPSPSSGSDGSSPSTNSNCADRVEDADGGTGSGPGSGTASRQSQTEARDHLPEDEDDEEEGEILPLLTKDASDGTGGLSLRQWAGKMVLLAASRQAVEDGLRHVLLASLGSSGSAGGSPSTRGSGKAPTSAKVVFLRGLYGSGLLLSIFFAVAGSSVVKKECVVFDPGTTSPTTLEDPHLQKQNLLLEPDVASALASTRWLWRWTNEEEEHADCIATSSAGISMLLLDFIGPLVVDFLPFERGGALRKHRALSLHTTAIFTTLACAGLFLLAIVDAGVGGSVEGSPDTTRASNKTKTFSFISDHHAELHPRTKSQRAAFEFRAKDYDTGSEQVVQVLAV